MDGRALAAVDAVIARLDAAVAASTSLPHLRLLGTQSQMLLAMAGTHRSIRRLVLRSGRLRGATLIGRARRDLEQSLDALPITRVQLERCFLALLLSDNPARWHARYRKNAWKAFAEKFFRDQRMLGRFEAYRDYFGPSGTGIGLLRSFAHEMDVSEDELQTLRAQVVGEELEDRFGAWFIPDMPTPGRCLQELSGPALKSLADLLYSWYDNLSHFSHGGLVGILEAAVLRGAAFARLDEPQRRRSWTSNVLEQTLPVSYVALLLVATLFAIPYLADDALRQALLKAWRPYHSDGSPLGVAVWDAWVAGVLGAEAPCGAAVR